MRLIKLGSRSGARKYTAVDDDVFEKLYGAAVSLRKEYTRVTFLDKTTKKVRCYTLHRIIAGAIDGEEVDHINGDKLDNRRCNLRICTPRENTRNRRKKIFKAVSFHSSIYKGVIKDRSNKWYAKARIGPVQPDGRSKTVYLGIFNTEIEAHAAYVSATKKAYGEFYREEALAKIRS